MGSGFLDYASTLQKNYCIILIIQILYLFYAIMELYTCLKTDKVRFYTSVINCNHPKYFIILNP